METVSQHCAGGIPPVVRLGSWALALIVIFVLLPFAGLLLAPVCLAGIAAILWKLFRALSDWLTTEQSGTPQK